jgi:hypothetical protein
MRQFLVLTLAAGLLLGACAPASPASAPPAEPGEPVAQPTAAPTDASPADAAPGDPVAATPTARAGLEATDPTSVALGAGRPVLLEFFAFW